MTPPGVRVVAIDGPAGAGKSTVARRLARRLGVPYLDTGAMYRALALYLLDHGIDPDDRAAVAKALPAAHVELRLSLDGDAQVLLGGSPVEERIRTPEVAAATSRAAVHPEVRTRMVTLQRELARRQGGVIEGRDIGTRVLPDAPFKFFLEASAEVRAHRRLGDLRARGAGEVRAAEVAAELAERDARDLSRAHSPLAPATDAEIIDTTGLDVEGVLDRMLSTIRRRGEHVPT